MKVRDLQHSYLFREHVKIWGEPQTRHRIIVAPPMSGMEATDIEHVSSMDRKQKVEKSSAQVSQALYNIDREIEKKQEEYEELRDWVDERKNLRKKLDGMGLDIGWLKSKTDKSVCEERVLEMMQEKEAETVEKKLPVRFKEAKITNAQVQMIPVLDTPLPMALAMIAEYLQSSKMRLVDLFARMDKNKDWNTSRAELKSALLATGIPLTETLLEELIITLDVNGDDQLSYQELARGIEAYHKDQRWQKVKSMYDSMSDDPTFFSEGNQGLHIPTPDTTNNEPPALTMLRRDTIQSNHLRLPKLDTCENPNLESFMKYRDVRLRKKEEMKERHRLRMKKKAEKRSRDNDVPISTTIAGTMAELKMQYLEFINKECERCIDLLQEAGIQVSSDSVRKALIPPSENETCKCVNHLRHERCIYPFAHSKTAGPRKRRQKRLRKMGERDTTSISTGKAKVCLLPRVATIDHRNRAKEGKLRRKELTNGEPCPYWTDGTLGKEVMCPDSGIEGFGKRAMFNFVKAKKRISGEYTVDLSRGLKDIQLCD